ncbi:MAG: RES family NAD+ phosphorylase [Mucilaginibacter sp.]
MILYRIVKCAYADLSGTGARLYGGRWNSEGRAMVYLTSSRSLAVLEALVHLSPTNLPDDFCIMTIDAPYNVAAITVEQLPAHWYEYPEPNNLKEIGNKFLAEKKHLLLKVPSAIVKEEYNYLLNPQHPEAGAVKISGTTPFVFDQRLTT